MLITVVITLWLLRLILLSIKGALCVHPFVFQLRFDAIFLTVLLIVYQSVEPNILALEAIETRVPLTIRKYASCSALH